MELTLATLLIILGIAQGFILGAVFLFSRFFQSQANQYLAYTFWTVSLMAVSYSLLTAGWTNKWLVLVNDIMWEYLFPATLLLYFVTALGHPLARQKRRYWLFLPFLLTLLINVIIDLDMDFDWYQLAWVNDESFRENYYVLEAIGALLMAVAVCVWIYQILQHYPPRVSTRWFRQFWLISTLVIAWWVITWTLSVFSEVDYTDALWAAVTILFFWVSYRGVFQFTLAQEKFEIRAILATQEKEMREEMVSEPEEPTSPYYEQLEEWMQKDHLYRDPNLSRDAVAKRLKISSGYLSQQLNASAGVNFSDYLNSYRVKEVKRLLVDPAFAQYSLLGIGYEAGFNSKSTYYAAFKKATGMTPSEFRSRKVEVGDRS